MRPLTHTQYQNHAKANPFPTIMTDNVLKTLCKTKRGSVPGPFCDPIDPLHDFATFCPQPVKTDTTKLQPTPTLQHNLT
jgi:hypothetical protein